MVKPSWQLLLLVISLLLYSWNYIEYRGALASDRFVFLDVGQGDSLLVLTRDGHSLLIDTGADNSVVYAISRHYRGKKLEHILITHPDSDHNGGLIELARYYKIGALYAEPDTIYEQLGLQSKLPPAQLALGCCCQINFLQNEPEALASNDRSMAVLIECGNLRLFAAGDLPASLEMQLSERLGDISVLKVGHHGSKDSTSLEFLQRVKPELAVISVGADNRYGHPHAEVLEALAASNVRTMRTDQLGDIELEHGGKSSLQITSGRHLW